MLNEQNLRKMINQISDPAIKKQLENVVGGKIIKQVRCLSTKCKGRIVASIYHDGQIIEVASYSNRKEHVSGVVSSRQRLDGQLGFMCACGNRSILADQEAGIITGRTPTKADLDKVYTNFQKKKSEYKKENGSVVIDNFAIDDMRF